MSTRLKNEASHLIAIHCCDLRLELAIKDIWKELPLISEMDTVLIVVEGPLKSCLTMGYHSYLRIFV